MSTHLESGQWGETLACRFLEDNGCRILERNWRYRRTEIDIIFQEGAILVFAEVKTRKSLAFGRPEEMVGQKKRENLYTAASAYMYQLGYEWEIRFDILAVYGIPGHQAEIEHFKDAFYPGIGGPQL